MFLQKRTMSGGFITSLVMLVIGACLAPTASAKDPYARPNNTWISISGTVKDVKPNAFDLDYGDGVIIVEMDDGDRDADGYKLLAGDKVTVNGMIDDDFFERTTIEASSVYVEKLGTSFYASSVDEEGPFGVVASPVDVSATVIRGVVTAVDDHEFEVDTALRTLTIEVEEMPYNPLDDIGYLKINVGDVVRVTGKVDSGLFDGHEVVAETVTKLLD